jgi:hypothetical protein
MLGYDNSLAVRAAIGWLQSDVGLEQGSVKQGGQGLASGQ